MRIPVLSGGRPLTQDVPIGYIADAVEAVRTSRVSIESGGAFGGVAVHQEGIWDYRRHLASLCLTAGAAVRYRLVAGPSVYRLLTPPEQEETGRLWKREGPSGSNWETERAETVAGLRHLAQPIRAMTEVSAGYPLHRYSFRIRPRPDTEDPLLAAVRETFRRNGIRRLTYDVWLAPDGRLVQTRVRGIMARDDREHRDDRDDRGGHGMIKYTMDSWDFGVDAAGLDTPSPDQIVPDDPNVPRPGLTVLIDGEISPY